MLAPSYLIGTTSINLVPQTISQVDSLDTLDSQDDQLCALIKAIAAGDERAFSALYDATASKLYGLALRLTNQTALAEEAVSEAYAQAWRQADRYEASRGKVSTWLLTICRSRALDLLRREQSAEDIDEHDFADTADGPDDLLEHTDTSTALQQALRQLDANQRQLLALAFFRGMSHSELADHTAMPLGTVKTIMRKGLTELRAILGSSLGLKVQ